MRKLNDEADFRFTDANGVELTDTQGNKLDELAGELGEDVYNVIYIRAHDLSSQTLNSATLRFYFYDNATPRHAVVPLNLIDMYYNSDPSRRVLEWTVVQNAN